MNSFTVELVSNASCRYFPTNSLSSFTNVFPESFDLEGEWEVALTEMSFPNMYQNITNGNYFLRYPDGNAYFTLRSGRYSSVQEVIDEMNFQVEMCLKLKKSVINATFDPRNLSISFTLPSEKYSLRVLDDDLANVLGLQKEFPYDGKGKHYSRMSTDLARFHSLMVYCDIVDDNVVGDVRAPLLRSFPLMGKLKEDYSLDATHYMNYQTFRCLQYKRVQRRNFHSIQITLRDASGTQMPFMPIGVTRLSLHFRKVDYHY